MGTRLYVGNLAYGTTEAELAEFFAQVGDVVEARIVTDRETGRSRGFGFVEMGDENSAQACIEQLDGQSLGGRTLRVNEARPRPSRPPREDRW
jgi:cold-inducible RNA-binding protein